MKSRTTKKFRAVFAQLPKPVQTQARIAYRLFKQNPNHPSLRFKGVSEQKTWIQLTVISKQVFIINDLCLLWRDEVRIFKVCSVEG